MGSASASNCSAMSRPGAQAGYLIGRPSLLTDHSLVMTPSQVLPEPRVAAVCPSRRLFHRCNARIVAYLTGGYLIWGTGIQEAPNPTGRRIFTRPKTAILGGAYEQRLKLPQCEKTRRKDKRIWDRPATLLLAQKRNEPSTTRLPVPRRVRGYMLYTRGTRTAPHSQNPKGIRACPVYELACTSRNQPQRRRPTLKRTHIGCAGWSAP